MFSLYSIFLLYFAVAKWLSVVTSDVSGDFARVNYNYLYYHYVKVNFHSFRTWVINPDFISHLYLMFLFLNVPVYFV